jgi:N-acyl-L-homoserine lactone synthetase
MSGTIAVDDRVIIQFSAAAGPFHVEFAVGRAPRHAEYKLRYDAFVAEHGWESASASPDGLERDGFDPFACAALLVEHDTGTAAACQRLILPERLPSGVLTNVQLEYRPRSLPPIEFGALAPASWAEVSRLTIAPAFRQGHSAAKPAMRAITYASLALAVAIDRRVLFSLSDPRTSVLSRRLGFEMHQVGELVDFHGPRAVFRIDVDEVVASVPADWRSTLDRLVAAARSVVDSSRRGTAQSIHAA